MKQHLVFLLTSFAGLIACGGGSTTILNDPSTLSEYPCGDPHLAWCPGHKTCCTAGEEFCEMTGNDAGTCEGTSTEQNGIDGVHAPHRRPQIVAAR